MYASVLKVSRDGNKVNEMNKGGRTIYREKMRGIRSDAHDRK